MNADLLQRLAVQRDHNASPGVAALFGEAIREIDRLHDVLHRDRSGLATALNSITTEIERRTWLLESRGPYEWDDDRYKDEAGDAMRTCETIARTALRVSGDIAHAECCGRGQRVLPGVAT